MQSHFAFRRYLFILKHLLFIIITLELSGPKIFPVILTVLSRRSEDARMDSYRCAFMAGLGGHELNVALVFLENT